MHTMLEVKNLITAGRMQEAEVLCTKLLEVKESAEGCHLLGYIAQQTGRYSLSIDWCIRANDLGLLDWSNHLILGQCFKALGEREKACSAFEVAHRMSPLNMDAAVFFLEEKYAAYGFDSAAAAYLLISPALKRKRLYEVWRKIQIENKLIPIRALMRVGMFDQAENNCSALLKEYPNKTAYRLLGHMRHYRRWQEYTSSKKRQLINKDAATISVMLITYNHEKYIAQALDSILMQETEYAFEIIVIEDCSTDKTRDVIMEYVNKYPAKIKAFFNPTNIGTLDPPQQKVTHDGFKRLTGDYIAILEGDDYWSSPHKLQKQISFLENNWDYVACAHNTIKKYENNSQPPHRFLYWENTKETHTVDDFIVYSFFHASSMIYRNYFQGAPPKYFRSKWSCDIFMNIYYAHHGNIKYINEDMSVYRAHPGGLYSTLSKAKGTLFNIHGIINYNRWFRYRYLKSFSFQIARRCQLLLEDETVELSAQTRLKYNLIRMYHGFVFKLVSRFPVLDPAVFWYGEPKK